MSEIETAIRNYLTLRRNPVIGSDTPSETDNANTLAAGILVALAKYNGDLAAFKAAIAA
jgi:hypothetical protein